jgi:hypothetical protein
MGVVRVETRTLTCPGATRAQRHRHDIGPWLTVLVLEELSPASFGDGTPKAL